MANILVCGGAGYIGSHMVRLLCEDGRHQPVVLDNLSMGHRESVPNGIPLVVGDIGDKVLLLNTLRRFKIDLVMHFAALLSVGDSVNDPLAYYRNNVSQTVTLLSAMQECGIDKFVFSSSAAVYGTPKLTPISEDAELLPINPYGRTKLIVENILADCEIAFGMRHIALRYFNAAGAHPTGEIGEDHYPETHLIPLVLQVASGKRDKILIFGEDYPTRDGSCIRDYVHISDLATAHLTALNRLINGGPSGAYNLGNGEGISVFEIVEACRQITGHPIPAEIRPRRAGDPPSLVANSALAEKELGWQRSIPTVEGIISTAWNWHRNHIEGYRG